LRIKSGTQARLDSAPAFARPMGASAHQAGANTEDS
jgi:hypothetical protein